MTRHYFLLLLFVAAGIISLAVSLVDSDWFFQSPNTRFIVSRWGRTAARWFYGVVGVVLLAVSALLLC